jgi:hypothetical protein
MLSAVIAVTCIASGLHAEYKKLTFFGQAEYLTYSDAFEKRENVFNDMITQDTNWVDANTSLTSSKKSAGGVGFRIGAMAPTPVKGLTIGGSFGYIMGPSFEGKETFAYDDGTSVQTDAYKWKDESKLWRYLGESKYSVPLGEKLQARVGFAIGLASLKVSEKFSSDSNGDFYNGSYSETHSNTTLKLTWEIGPAIAYVTDQIGVELALTYSQMPGAVDKNTFQEFNWNPFGIRLGVEF